MLVLSAITKGIKPDNDKLPPALNKGVLADCVSEIDKNTKADSKYHFDLNKMYETKLRALYLEDVSTGETETKWVVIPSKENDPENFESNVEKLKTLSHKNWCTKSFNAEPYLAEGDFHVYLENGEPKLGVRFVGDEIEEIQGELNDGKIPISYCDVVNDYLLKNLFSLSYDAYLQYEVAMDAKKRVYKIKECLKEVIEKNDVEKILKYFNFKVQKDKDGFLTIDKYRQPSNEFTFSDCGIDENKLFEKIKHIENNAYFEGSNLRDLGSLESIGNSVFFENSKITNLGKLKSIGFIASLQYSQVVDLGELETVGAYLSIVRSPVKSLGKLRTIYGNAYFSNSQLVDLGELESIGGIVYIQNSKLTPKDFENISVGGEIIF